jgi:hypothetical protein
VLFNKKDWGARSSDRRDIWRPDAWTAGIGRGLTKLPNSTPALTFAISDAFDVYPQGHLSITPDPSWLLCAVRRPDGGTKAPPATGDLKVTEYATEQGINAVPPGGPR